jgi:protein-disulfide isomerase
MVVFESFQCPACRKFTKTLAQVQQRFGDRMVVVFKHYPLSAGCNPRLSVDQQPGSCEIAWAAAAAHLQGRFWPFHDAIFSANTAVDEGLVDATVRQLGLDAQRFATDRRLASTIEQVDEDIRLGNRLKIPELPPSFLDGRLVRAADEATLEILIREESRVSDAASAWEHARAPQGGGEPGNVRRRGYGCSSRSP